MSRPTERRNFQQEVGSISSTETSARATKGIADADPDPFGDDAASRPVDRRTLLLAAAGALAAIGVPWPARAAGHATSLRAPDPRLTRSWQVGSNGCFTTLAAIRVRTSRERSCTYKAPGSAP